MNDGKIAATCDVYSNQILKKLDAALELIEQIIGPLPDDESRGKPIEPDSTIGWLLVKLDKIEWEVERLHSQIKRISKKI